jgi:iron complex transport system substrate-binding protein
MSSMTAPPSFRRLVPFAAALACAAALLTVVLNVRGTADAASGAARASNGVALPAHPTRIVSLSDASTEDLFAIGAGKQVVAVDQYSTYPPSAPRTKLSAFQPNVEAIAAYKPDLVVISDNISDLEQHLATLHIPVLLEAAPTGFAGIYDQILALGRVTGHDRQAPALVAHMKREVSAAVASVKRAHPPLKVYDELDQSYYSVTSKTFVGQVFTVLGLHDIADGAGKSGTYPQLSPEYIVASDPDLIVLSDTACCGESYAKIAARPGWSAIKAVADHDVVAVNDTVASEWGPRIVLFLDQVAGALRKAESRRP